MPGLTEGNGERLHFDSRTADRDPNRGTVKYEVEVVAVEPRRRVSQVRCCDASVMCCASSAHRVWGSRSALLTALL